MARSKQTLHKSTGSKEKEYDLNRKYKDRSNDNSRDCNRSKSEERHQHERRKRRHNSSGHQSNNYDKRDRYNNREKDRDDNIRNKSNKGSGKDDHFSSGKYNHDRSRSIDRNKSRGDEDQSKYRNKKHRSRSRSLNLEDIKWGKEDDNKSKAQKFKEKEKPNFSLSGKLTEETNTYRGVVIKYSEPPEARKPKRRWRLYPFKGEKALQTLYIHRESAYLIGRERKVVDLPVDHPSCSKQHAVLQYRLVPFTREDGSQGKRVRPYLIDLDSANGTFINNKKIDSRKYVELLEKDVIKFGYSSREYVLLHENSKDEAQDDDVKEEEVFESIKQEKV